MTPTSGSRRVWAALGGPAFLSPAAVLAFLAWSLTATVYAEVVVAGGPRVAWLTATVAVTVTVGAALLTFAALYLRYRPLGPGPWFAVAAYLVGGGIRGVLLWAVTERLGLPTSYGLASRVLQSAMFALVFMGATNIVVTFRREHRLAMRELGERQAELLSLRASLGGQIEQTRSELVEQVQRELGPTLEQLRAQLDSLANSPESTVRAIEEFRSAVSEVVRPLSRSLAEPPGVALGPVPARIPLRFATERLSPAAAIRPAESALLLLAVGAPLALGLTPQDYRNSAAPIRTGLLALLLWLALLGFKWLADRIQRELALRTLVPVLALAYLLIGVAVGFGGLAATALLPSPRLEFPAVALALCVLPPVAISLATVRDELARRAELRLADTVAQLELLTSVMRRELWRERRRLALTVHGPVQSALVAMAVTMSRPGFTGDQVPALKSTLDQAMAHINRSADRLPPVAAAARDLASLWVDSASINFTASDEATALIDRDESLATAVVEIMREGVSNAIRHGAADTIVIALDLDSEGRISVVIEDNGDGPPLAASAGLGSAMLDEIALAWSLERQGSTTQLRVELATEFAPTSSAASPRGESEA